MTQNTLFDIFTLFILSDNFQVVFYFIFLILHTNASYIHQTADDNADYKQYIPLHELEFKRGRGNSAPMLKWLAWGAITKYTVPLLNQKLRVRSYQEASMACS